MTVEYFLLCASGWYERYQNRWQHLRAASTRQALQFNPCWQPSRIWSLTTWLVQERGVGWGHRNLRTTTHRRRMHLCMQPAGWSNLPKIHEVRAPADMARLPRLINTKTVFSSKQPSPSAGTRYTYFELALIYKGNRSFLTGHSPSSSWISMYGVGRQFPPSFLASYQHTWIELTWIHHLISLTLCLSVCLSVCLFICLYVWMSLSVCLFVCLDVSVCLSVYFCKKSPFCSLCPQEMNHLIIFEISRCLQKWKPNVEI
jgi:hypothetical protein